MKLRIVLLSFFLLAFLIGEILGQNSWATHLRRSAKRIASVKKSLISRGLAKKAAAASANSMQNDAVPDPPRRKPSLLSSRTAKKTSSLIAAESGYGYMAKQYEDYQTPVRQTYTPPAYETGSCYGKPPGMIGNPEYQCKVFHICQADGRFDRMDCPATLRFNNYLGVCDWPDKVDAYCNPIYYYSEKPQREPYHYKTGNGPYVPSRDYEMSYAAAERYSTRAKTDEASAKDGEASSDRKKEKEKSHGKDKKEQYYEPDLSRRIT